MNEMKEIQREKIQKYGRIIQIKRFSGKSQGELK